MPAAGLVNLFSFDIPYHPTPILHFSEGWTGEYLARAETYQIYWKNFDMLWLSASHDQLNQEVVAFVQGQR
jgi:hypothetical protein